MKQIRKISIALPHIKDKYYVTDTGSIYVANSSSKVMKDGERKTVTKHFIKEAQASYNQWQLPFKEWGNYCVVLGDGTVLRRLTSTVRKDTGQVNISLISTLDKESKMYVSRVVAAVFLESVDGKEVHHKDRNRKNNDITNLEVLSFEEHRGCGSLKHV